MSKLFSQLQNYLETADKYKSNPAIYYFLKNYAFNKCCNFLSKDIKAMNEQERVVFDNLLNEYKNEISINQPNFGMNKEEYTCFLENFFGGVDFDHASLKVMETCRDLTEVIGVFGEMEELWQRRSKIICQNDL